MPAPGQQFGPYTIVSILGQGGMGTVFKALDPRLDRHIALKTLGADRDKERRQVRFAQEARAASALNHPNIITIYEIGAYEEQPYLAMELIEGRTLRSILKSGIPSLATLLPVFRQIAEAMAAAHAHGIVHRDLKPENIMVRADGYVKVLDFGLARQAVAVESDNTRSLITKPGTILGTTRYMSPEQALGEPIDALADMFSMGVVFYELLTGVRPFEASSTQTYLRAILTETPPHPSRKNSNCPEEFGNLVMQLLSQDKNQRPDAATVRAALAEPASLRQVPAGLRRTFVGREPELNQLRSIFDAVAVGRGTTVCLTGEPGLGKTTFVEEFLDDLASRGAACWIARGHCSERLRETDAYLAILDALASLVRGPSGDRANALLKEHAPTWQHMVAPAVTGLTIDTGATEARPVSHERMQRELLTFLEEVARLRPLVLFIDDVHWSDPSSSDVISYLGSRIGLSRILILVTYRPKQLAQHPFASVKLTLEGRGQCREVPLSFLKPADIELYVRRTFPANRFPDELIRIVHEKTEGNALFMSDMVRYLRDRQALAEENGTWILTRPLNDVRKEIPASIRSMIDLKIAQFTEEERRMLVAGAVQGVEFDTAVLSRVLKADPLDVEEMLQRMEQRQSFIVGLGEHELPDCGISVRYRFVHVFYQNALYASLTPSRRAALSRSIAETIVAIYSQERLRAMAADLAMLFEAARDFPNAATYFRVAARDAGRVFGYHESVLLCERGLRALLWLPESPERDREELMFSLTMGIALMATRGYAEDEVERTHLRSRELCLKLGETRRLFAVLWGLHTCYILRGDIRRALDFAREMRAAAEQRRDQFSMVESHHAMASTLSALGHMVEARAELDQLFAAYPISGHVLRGSLYIMDPYVTSLASLSRVDAFLGYLDRGLQAAREGVSLAERLGHAPSKAYANLWVGWMHYLRGEFKIANAHLESAVALSREHRLPQILEWNRMMVGASRSQLGDAEGILIMRTALANQERMRSVLDRGFCMTLLAEALLRHGQFDEASAALDTALRIAERTSEAYYAPEMHRLRAELLAANAGSPEEVDREIDLALGKSRAAQTRLLELRSLATLVRWRRSRGENDEKVTRDLEALLNSFTEGRDTPEIHAAAVLCRPSQRVHSAG